MGLQVQIHVHPPNTKGVIVECNSGGWFPKPLMEWRDSRGEVIPAATKSHSQDEGKLFNIKMILLIRDSSSPKVTCYLQNPLTGQEQRTSVAISGKVWVFFSLVSTISDNLKLNRMFIFLIDLVSKALVYFSFIHHIILSWLLSFPHSLISICLLYNGILW